MKTDNQDDKLSPLLATSTSTESSSTLSRSSTVTVGASESLPVRGSVAALPPLLTDHPERETPLAESVRATFDKTADDLYKAFKEILVQERESGSLSGVDNPEDLFIPPLATYFDEKKETHLHEDAWTKVGKFLSGAQKSLLILGNAGQGKTLLMKMLTQQLWKDYYTAREEKKSGVIPLYIHLPRVPLDNRKQKLLEWFLGEHGCNSKTIEMLNAQPLLLLLDGFDEIQPRVNFYRSNAWQKWQLRTITACRPEVFGKKEYYEQYFHPEQQPKELLSAVYQELRLALFEEEQIQAYVKQYVALKPPTDRSTSLDFSAEDWSKPTTYMDYLRDIPSLWELAQTPVVLSMLMPVLPQIISEALNPLPKKQDSVREKFVEPERVEEEEKKEQKQPVNPAKTLGVKATALTLSRVKLYDIFTQEWFRREVPRLLTKVTLFDKGDAERYCRMYTENLAYQALRKGKGQLEVVFDTKDTLEMALLKPEYKRRCPHGYSCVLISSKSPEKLKPGTLYLIVDNHTKKITVESAHLDSRKELTESVYEQICKELGTKEDKSETSIKPSKIIDEPNLVDKITLLCDFTYPECQHYKKDRKTLEKEETLEAFRRACLLKVSDGQFSFMHKTLIEYFTSQELFKGIYAAVECYQRLAKSEAHDRLGEAGKRLHFNQESLVDLPQVLAFLADRVKEDLRFKEILWDLVFLSKNEAGAALAAANAISVLAAAGESFSGKDLRNIYIPGANLAGAICENTNWQGADCRRVRFHNAWLAGANFQDTILEQASFGGSVVFQETSAVRSMTFSEDGVWLAVGNEEGYIGLYGQISGQLQLQRVARLENWSVWVSGRRNNPVLSLAFIPKKENGCLVAGSKDGYLRLWEGLPRGRMQSILAHPGGVRAVACCSDGKQIASGGADSTIRLWDVKLRPLYILHGNKDSVITSLSYHPSIQQLASGSSDKTIQLWDVDKRTKLQALDKHTNEVTSVAYRPDGQQLASASEDTTIRLWDAIDGKQVEEPKVLSGHRDGVMSVVYCGDDKSHQLASGSIDGRIRLWNGAKGTKEQVLCRHKHENGVTNVVYCHQSQQLASGSVDGTVRLWEMATNIGRPTLSKDKSSVMSMSYHPDGRQLACGNENKTIQIWDVATGAKLQALGKHESPVTSVAYRPDGQQLASAGGDRAIRLWDIATGVKQKVLNGHESSVTTVSYSPDGQQLASGSEDKTIRLWDIATGAEQKVLSGHKYTVMSVSYSPDKQHLASGSRDRTIRLWDIAKGAEYKVISGHKYDVTSVSYSPDGRQLASGSVGRMIRLWDTVTGVQQQVLKGHKDGVMSVVYRPDGKQLASGAMDKTIRLWDVHTGRVLQVLPHSSAVRTLVWNQHGNELCAGLEDGSLYHYRISAAVGERLTLRRGPKGSELVLKTANIKGALGISPQTYAFFKQSGTQDVPALGSKSLPLDPVTLFSAGYTLDAKKLDMRLVQHPRAKAPPPPIPIPSTANSGFLLSYDKWVISLMCKPEGTNPLHVFIIIEGIDAYGFGLILRYDLTTSDVPPGKAKVRNAIKTGIAITEKTMDKPLPGKARGSGVIKKNTSISDEFEQSFYNRDFLNEHRNFHHLSWCVSREKAICLLLALEADLDQAIPYTLLGGQSLLAQSSGEGDADNCFTWARKKLIALDDVNIKNDLNKHKNLDNIAAMPIFYLKPRAEEKTYSSRYCLTM